MGPNQTPLDQGAFVISIDTELAWSVVHRGVVSPDHLLPARSIAERKIVEDLLDSFTKYETKATWATVGHLFIDSCRPSDGRKHPEIQRPRYEWFEGDWFDLDPATNLASDPMWYGRDIVDMIRQAQPAQEIGSHSFSHLIVGDPGCSEDAFASDLIACHEAASALGLRLRSYVYPRNTIGHLGVLADHGFESYRGVRPATFPNLARLPRFVARMADRIRPLSGSVVLPERNGDLWNLPATNLYAPSDRAAYIPMSSWVGQQIRRLEHAARHQSLFHLWFHPHNLLQQPDQALQGLERILRRAARLRDQGRIENLTMGELTNLLNRLHSGAAQVRPAVLDDAG
jgi:peptidoglycan/xylan/chitin deacetylase (PgdA/CDA1 family)